MTRLLTSTSGNALTVAGGGMSAILPAFPAQSSALEWTLLSGGLIESVNNRIIQVSEGSRVWSFTIAAVEYFVDWVNGDGVATFTHNGVDYTLSVGDWGFCNLSYDPADSANLPADDTSATIATITSYKVATSKGDVLSTAYGSVDIILNGVSTGGVSDTVPPVVASYTPNGFSEALDQDTVLLCSESVQAGTGNFYKYNATTNTLIETIAAASATYGTTVTIPWTVPETNSVAYSIRWDAGTFEDLAGNPVAAQTDDSIVYTTVAAGGGSISASVDATVGSLSALYTQLQDWETNWNTTTPAGKTNADARVVGINASTTGSLNLSNYSFPHPVYVRHVGTFTGDAAGISSCSVNHTGTGTMANSTNLYLFLMDIRAPDNAAYNNGLFSINGTTDCGVIRCSLKGWPFTVDTSAYGTTSYFMSATGSTRFTYKNNTGYYFSDGHAKFFGVHTNPWVEGNMGNFFGGDDFTIANGASIVDPTWRCNFYARRRMMVPGNHNDALQFNKHPSGTATPATRWISRYDVFLRGYWGGGALTNPSESGWGAYWTADSTNPCIGPHLHEHCLFVNGHVRSVTGFPGGNLTVNYCSAIQHNNNQPPTAGWPAIRSVAAATGNFCVVRNSGFVSVEGTNGLRLILGGSANGTGGNFSLLLPYVTTIPTNYTDLWDIRPPVGAVTHPDYVGNKVGCWGLWQKLFNGDSDIVLSKVGWPVAPLFIADFDTGDNFWGAYTGTFDANGDNT